METTDVKGLKVHVVGQKVQQAVKQDDFPRYGKLRVYDEVTMGKVGELGDEDYGSGFAIKVGT